MTVLRILLIWIVLGLLAALAAYWWLPEPGLVLVRYGGMDYSSTLVGAGAILATALLLAWLLWTLVSLPFRAMARHRDRRARARLGAGLDALHAGQYERAEKLLEQAAEDVDIAACARVNAARAALARGDGGRTRSHLDALGEKHASARALAVADLALAEQRPADALAALDAAAAQPLPPRGLLLRAQALEALGQADRAFGLLDALRRQHALPATRLDALQSRWAEAMLRQADDPELLTKRWQELPKPLKSDPAVAAAYADRACGLHRHDVAAKALEQALDAHWDASLVERYGALPLGRIEARQAAAERWLRDHPTDPALLLTLARLYRLQGQTAKAEDALHRALHHGAGAPAWEEFGHGHSAAGDHRRARIAYANALRAGRGEAAHPLEPPTAIDAPDDSAAPIAEQRDENGLPRLPG